MISGIARATYYFYLNKQDTDLKNKDIIDKIKEIFYGQENNYKNIKELRLVIEEYIDYYNNRRIKEKLKGLTPAKYRNQSLLVNN